MSPTKEGDNINPIDTPRDQCKDPTFEPEMFGFRSVGLFLKSPHLFSDKNLAVN